MQQIYEAMFNDDGKYEVEIIGDAAAALKRLKAGKFDLVVLDIIMEPMSGDSFFVHARNDVKLKHIPILAVSILKQDTLHFLETLGNFHYLQKPITKEGLFKKMEEILT
jgi:CheY-like chemotaxis protein